MAQPAALVRATLFLRDAHNWRRGGSARALVAAGPPDARGWCHVVSVADPPQGAAQQARPQLNGQCVQQACSGLLLKVCSRHTKNVAGLLTHCRPYSWRGNTGCFMHTGSQCQLKHLGVQAACHRWRA